MRHSLGLPRIEEDDAAEHLWCAMRHTLSAGRHADQRRRQWRMQTWTQPLHSLMPNQGAPALRHCARESVDHMPPPRIGEAEVVAPGQRWCTCCRAAAVLAAGHAAHNHQCCSLAPAPAASTAGQLRYGTATHDPRGGPWLHWRVWIAFARKAICEVLLFFSAVSGRATRKL